MRKSNIITVILGLLLMLVSCEDYLDENPPGELAPESLVTTEGGIEALLLNAYMNYKFNYGVHQAINMLEWSTDLAYQTGGGENRTATLFINFQWDGSTAWLNNQYWDTKYKSIRDTNILIDALESAPIDEAKKNQFLAEARYVRAVNYVYLYGLFGPVPLRTSPLDEPELPRATDDEIRSFIESELEAAANDLPSPGGEPQFGRANKGAALAFLTRFHLNAKQWSKAADAANRVINLGYYELFPTYKDLFKVENEPDKNAGNKEMIAVSTMTNIHPLGNKFSNGALPPGFIYSEKLPEFVWTPALRNWASQYRLRDAFVDTFDKENDKRFELIIEDYYNKNNALINLRDTPDNARPMKYFDPNAEIASHGNDFPMIRYADILLMRAEALNETNGPTQGALDLVNEVRSRAGLVNLTLGDMGSKEALRDQILKERGWEFWSEGLRMPDLVRQGKFISGAQERGISAASDFHKLFPIPQIEMDANPNMVQNPGY